MGRTDPWKLVATLHYVDFTYGLLLNSVYPTPGRSQKSLHRMKWMWGMGVTILSDGYEGRCLGETIFNMDLMRGDLE